MSKCVEKGVFRRSLEPPIYNRWRSMGDKPHFCNSKALQCFNLQDAEEIS